MEKGMEERNEGEERLKEGVVQKKGEEKVQEKNVEGEREGAKTKRVLKRKKGRKDIQCRRGKDEDEKVIWDHHGLN